MSELEIDIYAGPVRAIAIPGSFSDNLLINGPCEFCGWSVRDVGGEVPASSEGQVVSPGAGATIVTLTGLGAGLYQINWIVQLIGAAAAADQNNFKLVSSGGLSVVSLNAGAAGQYLQDVVQASVALGGSVSVQAVAAGTVGVTYAAQLSLQAVGAITSAGEFQDGNNALGETSATAGSTDTHTEWGGGLQVRQRLNFHPVGGLMSGVAYVRYSKNTG